MEYRNDPVDRERIQWSLGEPGPHRGKTVGMDKTKCCPTWFKADRI